MSCQKRRKTLERMFKISQRIEEAVQTASKHPQTKCGPYWHMQQNLVTKLQRLHKTSRIRDRKPLQSLLQYFPLLPVNSFETTIFSAYNKPLWFSPNALRLYLNLYEDVGAYMKSLGKQSLFHKYCKYCLVCSSSLQTALTFLHCGFSSSCSFLLLTCSPSVLQDVLVYTACKISNINISFLSVMHPSIY